MKKLQFASVLALAVLATSSSAFAQDAYGSYYGPSTFEGIYAGGYGGGMLSSSPKWTGGVFAGANFEVTESVFVGAEAQGGVSSNGTTTIYDGLMLGKVGALVSPETMAYGAAGGGVINGNWSWAAGGGAEYIAADSLGVRGEVLAIGNSIGGWTDTKATAGLVWHVK